MHLLESEEVYESWPALLTRNFVAPMSQSIARTGKGCSMDMHPHLRVTLLEGLRVAPSVCFEGRAKTGRSFLS